MTWFSVSLRWQRLATIALALLVAVVAMVAGATSAAADSLHFCNNPNIPADDKTAQCGTMVPEFSLLPVERWAGVATSLHLRTDNDIITNLANSLQREGVFPLLMSFGNTLWGWATSLITAAIRLDLLNTVGAQIDGVAASIGGALLSSGLVAFFLVVGLVALLWRAARGNSRPGVYLGKVVIIGGMLAAMVVGATNSTGTGGNYDPGTFSPGWLATTVNSSVSTIASAPAGAITMGMSDFESAGDEGAPAGSCDAYVAQLNADFVNSAADSSGIVQELESAVPMVMSRMWEQTGLQSWKISQFGSNPYGDWMYCRMLEERAGIASVGQTHYTRVAGQGNVPAMNLQSAAWGTGEDVEARDRSMIAWAACRPTGPGDESWEVAGDWGQVERSGGMFSSGTDPISAEDCADWWQDSYFTGDGDVGGIIDGGGSNFEFEGNTASDVSSTTTAPDARNFLLALHGGGVNSAGNLVLAGTYLFAALCIFVVFGALALLLLLAKVSMLAMVSVLVLVMLMDLLPGRSASTATAKFARMYLGFAFVAFGMNLIISFIALMTSILIDAAAGMFGGDSAILMLWTGVAPLVAVVVVHMVFTKVLRVPSPLSITGAQQWGAAASGGAIGATMGTLGAGALQRMTNRGKDQAKSSLSAAKNKTADKLHISKAHRQGAKSDARTVASPTTTAATGVMAGAGAGVVGGAAGAAAGAAGAGRKGRMGAQSARALGGPGAGAGGAAGADGGSRTTADAIPGGLRDRKDLRDAKRTERSKKLDDLGQARTINRGGTQSGALRGNVERAGDWAKVAGQDRLKAIDGWRARRNEEAIDRRGYGTGYGQGRHGAKDALTGGLREGASKRMSEVRSSFRNNPVKQTLKSGSKLAAKGAGAVVLTAAAGPVAIPAMAGVWAGKKVWDVGQARRRSVTQHRSQRAAMAAQAQERAQKQAERQAAYQGPAPAPAGRAGPGEPSIPQPAAPTPQGRKVRVHGRTRSASRSGPSASPGQRRRMRTTRAGR